MIQPDESICEDLLNVFAQKIRESIVMDGLEWIEET
jgi:hypothetical protein